MAERILLRSLGRRLPRPKESQIAIFSIEVHLNGSLYACLCKDLGGGISRVESPPSLPCLGNTPLIDDSRWDQHGCLGQLLVFVERLSYGHVRDRR